MDKNTSPEPGFRDIVSECLRVVQVRFLSIRAKGFQRIVVEWASPSVVRYQVTGASLTGNSAHSTWKHLAGTANNS